MNENLKPTPESEITIQQPIRLPSHPLVSRLKNAARTAIFVLGSVGAAVLGANSLDNSALGQVRVSKVSASEKGTPKPQLTSTPTRSEEVRVAEVPPQEKLFTDSLGRSRRWVVEQLSSGIAPNNPSARRATINDHIDETLTNFIQPQETLYRRSDNSIPITLALGGMEAKVDDNRGYMLVYASQQVNNNNYDPHFESVANLNNPTDFSVGARIRVNSGLPQGGLQGNGPQTFSLGNDAQGDFLNLVFNSTETLNPAEAGTYRIRLQADGSLESSAVKIADEPTVTPTSTATPSPTNTPTQTPSPTETPTPTATRRALFRAFLPAAERP